MMAPSGRTVGRLIRNIPAQNDGGGLETISDIPQTGVTEKLHCVYGKTHEIARR
jgi:hypothetical protein